MNLRKFFLFRLNVNFVLARSEKTLAQIEDTSDIKYINISKNFNNLRIYVEYKYKTNLI